MLAMYGIVENDVVEKLNAACDASPSPTAWSYHWQCIIECRRRRRIASAADAIALIHESGGLAVIAHPGINHRDDVIPQLVDAGIDGIECFHTRHSTAASEHYLLMAEQYGLAITGGSDCHGMNKGKPLMGGIKLPLVHVRQLEQRARAIREKALVAA